MFPETILFGTYNFGHAYIIEYNNEYSLAGLPPYYIHRARYKGDKMKNQRKVSELPLPEPRVVLGGEHSTDNWGDFFADVVFAETFEECLAFLPQIRMAMTFEGSVSGIDFSRFINERKRIDMDARIAHEDEKHDAMLDTTQPHQIRMF